uniref:AlNc14C155G7616 protein n=1 Tax=Albugo laibachii Nc14 TaxID=890382 RepID=F0WMB1_9STRA|nr:AlNc14C155G7616 [Albugo laibachii Nc14]|eukprot:CCA22442.1 AlNc14C155G7616 [Albugo laibachii Nc14]
MMKNNEQSISTTCLLLRSGYDLQTSIPIVLTSSHLKRVHTKTQYPIQVSYMFHNKVQWAVYRRFNEFQDLFVSLRNAVSQREACCSCLGAIQTQSFGHVFSKRARILRSFLIGAHKQSDRRRIQLQEFLYFVVTQAKRCHQDTMECGKCVLRPLLNQFLMLNTMLYTVASSIDSAVLDSKYVSSTSPSKDGNRSLTLYGTMSESGTHVMDPSEENDSLWSIEQKELSHPLRTNSVPLLLAYRADRSPLINRRNSFGSMQTKKQQSDRVEQIEAVPELPNRLQPLTRKTSGGVPCSRRKMNKTFDYVSEEHLSSFKENAATERLFQSHSLIELPTINE